jgi:hypothetical protein
MKVFGIFDFVNITNGLTNLSIFKQIFSIDLYFVATHSPAFCIFRIDHKKPISGNFF